MSAKQQFILLFFTIAGAMLVLLTLIAFWAYTVFGGIVVNACTVPADVKPGETITISCPVAAGYTNTRDLRRIVATPVP